MTHQYELMVIFDPEIDERPDWHLVLPFILPRRLPESRGPRSANGPGASLRDRDPYWAAASTFSAL